MSACRVIGSTEACLLLPVGYSPACQRHQMSSMLRIYAIGRSISTFQVSSGARGSNPQKTVRSLPSAGPSHGAVGRLLVAAFHGTQDEHNCQTISICTLFKSLIGNRYCVGFPLAITCQVSGVEQTHSDPVCKPLTAIIPFGANGLVQANLQALFSPRSAENHLCRGI